MRFYYIQGPLH